MPPAHRNNPLFNFPSSPSLSLSDASSSWVSKLFISVMRSSKHPLFSCSFSNLRSSSESECRRVMISSRYIAKFSLRCLLSDFFSYSVSDSIATPFTNCSSNLLVAKVRVLRRVAVTFPLSKLSKIYRCCIRKDVPWGRTWGWPWPQPTTSSSSRWLAIANCL